jgi:hypothetical protein
MDAGGALWLLTSFDLINCILPMFGSLTMLRHPFRLMRTAHAMNGYVMDAYDGCIYVKKKCEVIYKISKSCENGPCLKRIASFRVICECQAIL